MENFNRVIIEATIKKTEYKLDSRQLAILTCLAGLAGSFPPSTMNVYVCPLSTVISGMSKSLMYHAIPQAGCPIYLLRYSINYIKVHKQEKRKEEEKLLRD